MPTNVASVTQNSSSVLAINATGYYPRKEASRLARVSPRILALWDKKGIVVPTVLWVDENGVETPGYSFDGLVYLRLIRMLRGKKFSLRKIVVTLKYLIDNVGRPGPSWEDARIWTDGSIIWVDKPVVAAASRSGQMTLFAFEFEQMGVRSDALLVPSEYADYVEINPAIRNGMPVIRGTSIETAIIKGLRHNGLGAKAIHSYYPALNVDQIKQGADFEEFLDREAKVA